MFSDVISFLGYIMMFIFMPAVFPDDFTMYIGQIISPILRALADENEFVRYKKYSNKIFFIKINLENNLL